MRFKVSIHLDEEVLVLPLNYREMIQGILYSSMPEAIASAAHKQIKGIRKMPLFTFSRLFGKSSINMATKDITFKDCYFYFSCVDDNLALKMKEGLQAGVLIYNQYYQVTVNKIREKAPSHKIYMLSPVTARKTDIETKKTTFFEPNTIEFSNAIYQNLVRKHLHFYGEEYNGPFAIIAENDSIKGTNAKFENLYIKGYMGNFQLVVSDKAFELLYKIGLGEKNAQGFGMFEVKE